MSAQTRVVLAAADELDADQLRRALRVTLRELDRIRNHFNRKTADDRQRGRHDLALSIPNSLYQALLAERATDD